VAARQVRLANPTPSRRDAPAKGHLGAWIAWGICTMYWVAISAGYALQLSHGTAQAVADELGWRIGYGSFATVGAVIVSRRSRNVIGWILCAVGLTSAVAGFAQDYATWALVHRPQWLSGGLLMGWLGSWPWYIAFGLIISFLPLLFPDGRLPSRRWLPVAWLAGVLITLLCVWAAFVPRPFEGPPAARMPQNPWAIERAEGFFRLLEACFSAMAPAVAFVSLASLVLRFRRSRGVERQQLKWFTYVSLLGIGSWGFVQAADLEGRLSGLVWVFFMMAWFWAIPVAIGIAILRHRLYDIDRLINRTLVYGALTVLLGAVYAGAVLVGGQLFGGLGGQPPSWAVAGATLAVAALFQPARRRIQQAVDRRFNRRRYDAARIIEAFSSRLRAQVDLDTLAAELLAVVNQTMEPTSASLWLRPSPGRVVEPWQQPTSDPTALGPSRGGL
jgi:hypothetical protein